MTAKIKWIIRGFIYLFLSILFLLIGPFEWATESKSTFSDVWKKYWDTWTMDWS